MHRIARALASSLLAGLFLASSASADTHTKQETSRQDGAWHLSQPAILQDLRAGKPLVVQVFVPLCSNAQIDCGASWAGQPGRLETNLYWGAIFGARRIFERKDSGWERVELKSGGPQLLERAVYRRHVPAERWGLQREAPVEQLVVLQAIHGEQIDHAVGALWQAATTGSQLSFVDNEVERSVDVHAVGYAGHNRLMDGLKLPAAPEQPSAAAKPSFVLACYSESYFARSLRSAGSEPLVTTRALMAPEGYLVEAVARGLGDNLSVRELDRAVVRTYARWQRISEGQARRVFSPR